MAKIGTFKKAGTNAYTGKIETLTINAEISLEPVRSSNDKAPDFEVFAGTTQVGIAYKKTSDRGNEYISLLLDDPTFAKPFWCTLFLNENGAECPLMWERPRKKD
jgi:uncharacterized protein (DUF736 family)